ncbi:hypothetical protein [Streptomyces sp. NPDC059862]|uniref:hypothetical protein n=1 Tax=unclassified Streptomyces TaxID=2593676 RepID=UPI00362F0D7F
MKPTASTSVALYQSVMKEMEEADVLIDTYGRVATDLRVSLTDRCNLRCTY